MTLTTARPERFLRRRLATKVPQITLLFWIIKILTTAGGETTADYLASLPALGLTGALLITGGLLAASLLWQLSVPRYLPVVYWTAIVLVGVAGTLITDIIVMLLGVSEAVATVGFSVVLVATFGLWYVSEGTLSIHSIHTRQRELFYWAAVLITFALGTAAGDLTAFALGWGFPASIALYGAVFAAAAVAHLRFGVNAILTFWVAYVVTRPFGASIADYLALPADTGALDLGLWQVSAAFLTAITIGVAYLAVTGKDTPKDAARAAAPPNGSILTGQVSAG